MGLRESRESFRGSNTNGFKGFMRDRENRNETKPDVSSRHSNKRGVSLNKAHISQTKFELNPPGLDQGNFTSVNNGVVLIMNQSQRDYYRQGHYSLNRNQRGIKLVPMQGSANETKQRVLNLIHQERNLSSRNKIVNSRSSDNRGKIGSKQYGRNLSNQRLSDGSGWD